MDMPALSDPAVFPTEEVLSAHLGRAKAAFDHLFQFNHATFPEFVERWKYYTDGKSWLLNVSRKKKTLFWLSVRERWFRTTFYLNAKAARSVPASKIPEELKAKFRESEGKITVEVRTKKDIDVYKEVLALKMATM